MGTGAGFLKSWIIGTLCTLAVGCSPVKIYGPTSNASLELSSGNSNTQSIQTNPSSFTIGKYGKRYSKNLPVTTHSPATTPQTIGFSEPYLLVKQSYYGSTVCGITTSHILKCWGQNTNGQIGDGTQIARLTPTEVDPGVQYSDVSLGAQGTTCAITSSGVLKCWGTNFSGQVGDGTTTRRLSPVVIDPGVSYSMISADQGWHLPHSDDHR